MVDANLYVDRWQTQFSIPEGGYVNLSVPKHITPESLEMVKQIIALQFDVFERSAALAAQAGGADRG